MKMKMKNEYIEIKELAVKEKDIVYDVLQEDEICPQGNIMTFERYGKLPFYRRIAIKLKNRFNINPMTKRILQYYGMDCYTPKISKIRLTISMFLSAVIIVIPFITPLAIPVILWGLK